MQLLSDFYSKLCCEIKPEYPSPYHFNFGTSTDSISNKQKFQSNEIKTTKYNIFNFVPKAVLTQYRRLANLYFLIVAIISSIPGTTPLNPALIWMPLIAVLIVSIVKQAYQDYQRYKLDKQINSMNEVSVIREGKIVQISWQQLRVGDLCKIKQDQTMPADLLLISCSDPDGIIYIETASLDGQKTSKIRYAYHQLKKYSQLQKLQHLNGQFIGSAPSQSLQQFTGQLIVPSVGRLVINDNKQLLFRESKLKNTLWVWGLAVYVGPCSKIMMNNRNFKSKISSVERKLNYMLIILLLIQITLCIIVAVLSISYQSQNKKKHHYIIWRQGFSKGKLFAMTFLSYFVDFSSIIPVSLIVSIQLIKLAQSYFIDFDKLMYNKQKKRGVLAKCAALNEQLGQIQYVFTDKTGTLTKNKMVFHTAVIGNFKYAFKHHQVQNIYTCPPLCQIVSSPSKLTLSNWIKLQLGNDTQFGISNMQQLIHEYFMCLLICNNVNTVGENPPKYESESPDELALVKMAECCGYQFLKRDNYSIIVKIKGNVQKIRVLQKFNFTSERKRMSVIVELNGRIIMYTKGADNVISQRIAPTFFKIEDEIDNLSREGLRTLMVGMKVIPNYLFAQFKEKLNACSHTQKQTIISEFATQCQTNIELLGATGLLDELQDEVGATLKDFQRANIRVWMLTGDKLETATQVAKTCKLIEPDYTIFQCRSDNIPIKNQLDRWEIILHQKKEQCSLIIEGSKIAEILKNEQISKQFALISDKFKSVICCRMLPIQKSQVVKLIRKHLKKICLSVGDGGNDVSMIKQANIGVGLYGEEGMNAVQASDYAIPQFRMLWRLIFVHGRWNYMRISEMILYFTYKTVLFTVPRIIFSFKCGFSGQPIYNDYYIALYNILFTSIPLIIRALFEQDINYIHKGTSTSTSKVVNSQKNLSSTKELQFLPPGYSINNFFRRLFPKIYFMSQKNQIFNFFNCFIWMLQSICMGVITTLIIMHVFSHGPIGTEGYNSDIWIISITIYSTIIIIDTIKLATQIRHWTLLVFISIIVCSLTPYLIYIWISNYRFSRYMMEGAVLMSFKISSGYFSVLFISIVTLIVNTIANYISFQRNKLLSRMKLIMKQIDQQIKTKISQDDFISEQFITGSRGTHESASRNDQEYEIKMMKIKFKEEVAPNQQQ